MKQHGIAMACWAVIGLQAFALVSSAEAETSRSVEASEGEVSHADDVDPVEILLGADLGYRSLQVRSVRFEGQDDVSPTLLPSTSHGAAPGLSLGLRLLFLSITARGEMGLFYGTRGDAFDDRFRMYNLDLELAFRAPLGRLQPWIMLGGGYTGIGNLSEVIDGERRRAQSRGGNVRLGAGLDFFWGSMGMVGLRGTLDGVFLSSSLPVRELVTPEDVDTVGEAKERVRDADGLVLGFSPALSVVLGLRL